jgi:fatty acid desaturase
MGHTPAITDPRYEPHGRRSLFDRAVLPYLNDERDLPFARLIGTIAVVLPPFAAYLYLPGRFNWWLGGLYLAVLFGLFFDRFILMLHNTSHRTLFRRRYRWLNRIVPWALSPFFGQTPDTYFTHHVGMHHAEENLREDLSSTMPYRRDSIVDFLRYWLRFFVAGLVELSLYHARKRRWKLFKRTVVGEVTGLAVLAGLLWLDWQATLVVFVIPFLAARFLMMAGNWAQHAFVDPADPGNPYKNSIVCINTRYNQRCFNDGYHIGHHEKPNRHWTDMPADFESKRSKYAQQGAIVFEGIDYFGVWALLMLKRYGRLAARVVDLEGTARSREEVERLLRSRTQPIR